MLFRLTAKKKGMLTIELGLEVGVQQKTAWLFRRKVQQMMKYGQQDKIGGNAEADEFLQGGYKIGKGGRSLENKEAVLIVREREKLGDGRTGKIALRHIDNFEAATLQCHLSEMTEPRYSCLPIAPSDGLPLMRGAHLQAILTGKCISVTKPI